MFDVNLILIFFKIKLFVQLFIFLLVISRIFLDQSLTETNRYNNRVSMIERRGTPDQTH